MKSDKKGSSTCQPGMEQFEDYKSTFMKKKMVQYDYRTTAGVLFSCIGDTVDECRQKRDRWLTYYGYSDIHSTHLIKAM